MDSRPSPVPGQTVPAPRSGVSSVSIWGACQGEGTLGLADVLVWALEGSGRGSKGAGPDAQSEAGLPASGWHGLGPRLALGAGTGCWRWASLLQASAESELGC